MASAETAARRALLDVSVLIALHDEQHVDHRAAADWPSAHARGGRASCALTQNACVRILSHPDYPNPVPPADAHTVLSRSCAQAGRAFWPDDISLLDAARLDHGRTHGHRQINDLYLLALAAEHDGCFVRFDAQIPLSAVRGATARHLVSIQEFADNRRATRCASLHPWPGSRPATRSLLA
jgi:uncharacterized protein